MTESVNDLREIKPELDNSIHNLNDNSPLTSFLYALKFSEAETISSKNEKIFRL